MGNLDNLVLKTRDGYGGLGVYILPDLPTNERSEACRAMLERPDAFIAQEMLEFSRHLVYDDEVGWFNERYVDLRVYAVQDANGIMVFPGGLTRVARKGSRVTNNSSGGACKPTWVVT
jgi:carboxylate-amine ligase